jgi:hypothetical protein
MSRGKPKETLDVLDFHEDASDSKKKIFVPSKLDETSLRKRIVLDAVPVC